MIRSSSHLIVVLLACSTLTSTLTSTSVSLAGPVVINEIHLAPRDKTVPEEFVELYSVGSAAIDLGGWYISGGIDFTFPPGTTIGPGEYLVVAQDPATVVRLYGPMRAVGPFTGRLGNDGDDIVLRNPRGGREDEVHYKIGFPWPTVGGSEGYSMELIHPDLDNDLGGSWRISNPNIVSDSSTLIAAGERWKYFEGLSEASSPVTAWRAVDFDDAAWTEGNLAIGYGESFLKTTLDMRNRYTCVFLRKTFQVEDPDAIGGLVLEAQYDDGFNAWINGFHVAGANLSSPEMPFDGVAMSALESADFQEFRLPRPGSYLVAGTNVIAVQLHNSSIGSSSDAYIDLRLIRSSGAGAGPTPGAQNAFFTLTSPPILRQVAHLPEQPVSGSSVVISVKATDPDGVSRVTLDYQVVEPGSYIRLGDPAYKQGWTTVEMRDDGAGGDELAGDDVYTVALPGTLQVHRRLVRYRISAEDAAGISVTVPYPDDPQPNFAYLVYDGVPGWKGASRPGVTPVLTFSAAVMGSLPVYHLIAVEQDVLNSQYNSAYENTQFQGTLVYDGVVYDHIEFETRGEFSTYVSGKNKWRLHLNRGHDFQARDDYGRKYRSRWRTMVLSAVASPWVPTNRGMAGLDEGIAFRLYTHAGVPCPNTNFFHFRIIDEAVEAHPTDQYRGDLWGLYLTIEYTDGRYLDEHGLPDGNTYKIEGGNGDKRNQGPTQSVDASDYNALKSGYSRSQPIQWWRDNVDLPGYYAFRAIDRAVNNHDLREGWNICQYHNPETNRWTAIPWDLDMLYMPVTHWSGVMDFQNAVLQHPALNIEYQSRARELQDLLLTPDQLDQLIGEFAAFVNPPGEPLTFVDVDEAMWNYHPRTTSSHKGAFYKNPSTHSAIGGTITRTLVSADHEGMVQWVKDFVLQDYGAQQLEAHAYDAAIPNRPTIAYVGAAGFPVDGLSFRTSAFGDPQGAGTFGALKWRVAEVAPPGAPLLAPDGPKPLEVHATWESEELTAFQDTIGIPPEALKIGARYRARVRMKDATGRWGHWSAPLEFTSSPPAAPFAPQSLLRITEIMYHPPGGSDYEFVELKNIGPDPLNLTHVAFTAGIEFRFAEGSVQVLEPGAHVLVVKDLVVFGSAYDISGMNVAGEFSGQLENAGERIVLTYGANATILDFAYGDDWYPFTDGAGYSLVVVDALGDPETWGDPRSWKQSASLGGSPGADDGSGPPARGLQVGGDSNQDGTVDISDAVSLLLRLFLEGGPLPCEGDLSSDGNLRLLDVTGDGSVDVSDAIYLLGYLFKGGAAPVQGSGCEWIAGCPSACRL